MPSLLIDTPKALDAAIAASLRARCEKLVRTIRNQRLRTGVGFGLCGCLAIFALAAFFLANDPEAATIIAMMTCVLAGFTYVAGKAGRKKAVDSLREMN
jgi:uncharacterized membrane protein YadS